MNATQPSKSNHSTTVPQKWETTPEQLWEDMAAALSPLKIPFPVMGDPLVPLQAQGVTLAWSSPGSPTHEA